MPIYPLPQFEIDVKQHLDEEDRKAYEALKAPKTMVVRFGAMKMVGEFPYNGTVKPGCGSKIVVKTHRGTELGEMLTSTCPNSGCAKSVSRKEMLQYIQNSGGREYPFSTEGRVLRVAEAGDMQQSEQLEQSRHGLRVAAKAVVERLGQTIKIVDAEPILGGETLTFYYLSEERGEVGELLDELRREFRGHIELRNVGARDEARITADYERCGQYCCCKNFLKVLKPVSMKSAKTQKATLDPLKISGRCGRLMCCLRYEDQTYEDLKKNLPRKKSRVGTPEGDATVLDAQILTQLVLVELDRVASDGKTRQMAVAVEDLTPPVSATAPTDLEPYANPARRPPAPMGSLAPRAQRASGPGLDSASDERNNRDDGNISSDRTQAPGSAAREDISVSQGQSSGSPVGRADAPPDQQPRRGTPGVGEGQGPRQNRQGGGRGGSAPRGQGGQQQTQGQRGGGQSRGPSRGPDRRGPQQRGSDRRGPDQRDSRPPMQGDALPDSGGDAPRQGPASQPQVDEGRPQSGNSGRGGGGQRGNRGDRRGRGGGPQRRDDRSGPNGPSSGDPTAPPRQGGPSDGV